MTPLLQSAQIAPNGLHFKLESCNPSGSYKDRFIAAEIQSLKAAGAVACLATSSGNTGSALAAACARFGMRCIILVNANAPSGKLVQMQAHGATLVRIPEFTPSVFDTLGEFTKRAPLVVSAYCYCPIGMQGVEKIASEIHAQLPDVEHVFVPVGGGGLYCAVARGFADQPGVRVHAVQPEGCPTLLNAVRRGTSEIERVTLTTKISGLAVPFDLDAGQALSLLRANGGMAIGVTDDEVYAAQQLLLRKEGIYAEPAAAASVAGYLQCIAAGRVSPTARSACLITGHGFKDPASMEAAAALSPGVDVANDHLWAQLDAMLSEVGR